MAPCGNAEAPGTTEARWEPRGPEHPENLGAHLKILNILKILKALEILKVLRVLEGPRSPVGPGSPVDSRRDSRRLSLSSVPAVFRRYWC